MFAATQGPFAQRVLYFVNMAKYGSIIRNFLKYMFFKEKMSLGFWVACIMGYSCKNIENQRFSSNIIVGNISPSKERHVPAPILQSMAI
jgi:hypothetical protein